MYNPDSVRYALAVEDYDVRQQRPGAPGYILYVALGKLFSFFAGDAGTGLVWVSVIFSALTVFFLYRLSKDMYGLSNGVISSLLLVSNPLYWFNGEVPLPYVVEGFFSVAFAFICYRIITDRSNWLLASAIILGLASGVRQSTPFLLLPLWLFSMRKCPLRQIAISILTFAGISLAWYVAMAMLSGGIESYIKAVRAQFNFVVVVTHIPFWEQVIKYRSGIFARFMAYGITLGIIPLFYYFGRFFKIPLIAKDVRLRFLILWFLPSMIFFVTVNIWNPGHVIIILPPLLICIAESTKGLAGDLSDALNIERFKQVQNILVRWIGKALSYRVIVSFLTAFLIIVNICAFLFTDIKVSYSTIRNNDNDFGDLVRLTRENFIPERTMILTVMTNTQASYYLRDYLVYCPLPLMFDTSMVPVEVQNLYVSFNGQTTPKTYWIPTEFKIEPIDIPDGIDTIVIWGDEIHGYYQNSDRPLQEVKSYPGKSKVYFLRANPGEKIYYNYHYLFVG